MGKVRRSFESHPFNPPRDLGEEGQHGHVLSLVLASVDEQSRNVDPVQVWNDGPVAKRT